MLPVAILAGGLATRLRPITETIPKALVTVAGEPFIMRQLGYLHEQGVRQVVICTGYRGEQVEALVGDGQDLGLQVSYSFDGPRLLGTGGALKKALSQLGEAFFVLYGDSYLPIAYGPVEVAFHVSGKPALMTVLQNADQWDKSNVEFLDSVVVEYDKKSPKPAMRYIDYGLSVLSSRALDEYPADAAFDLSDVFHQLSLEGKLAGFEVHERFYEIGSPAGLAEAEAFFTKTENI